MVARATNWVKDVKSYEMRRGQIGPSGPVTQRRPGRQPGQSRGIEIREYGTVMTSPALGAQSNTAGGVCSGGEGAGADRTKGRGVEFG